MWFHHNVWIVIASQEQTMTELECKVSNRRRQTLRAIKFPLIDVFIPSFTAFLSSTNKYLLFPLPSPNLLWLIPSSSILYPLSSACLLPHNYRPFSPLYLFWTRCILSQASFLLLSSIFLLFSLLLSSSLPFFLYTFQISPRRSLLQPLLV